MRMNHVYRQPEGTWDMADRMAAVGSAPAPDTVEGAIDAVAAYTNQRKDSYAYEAVRCEGFLPRPDYHAKGLSREAMRGSLPYKKPATSMLYEIMVSDADMHSDPAYPDSLLVDFQIGADAPVSTAILPQSIVTNVDDNFAVSQIMFRHDQADGTLPLKGGGTVDIREFGNCVATAFILSQSSAKDLAKLHGHEWDMMVGDELLSPAMPRVGSMQSDMFDKPMSVSQRELYKQIWENVHDYVETSPYTPFEICAGGIDTVNLDFKLDGFPFQNELRAAQSRTRYGVASSSEALIPDDYITRSSDACFVSMLTPEMVAEGLPLDRGRIVDLNPDWLVNPADTEMDNVPSGYTFVRIPKEVMYLTTANGEKVSAREFCANQSMRNTIALVGPEKTMELGGPAAIREHALRSGLSPLFMDTLALSQGHPMMDESISRMHEEGILPECFAGKDHKDMKSIHDLSVKDIASSDIVRQADTSFSKNYTGWAHPVYTRNPSLGRAPASASGLPMPPPLPGLSPVSDMPYSSPRSKLGMLTPKPTYAPLRPKQGYPYHPHNGMPYPVSPSGAPMPPFDRPDALQMPIRAEKPEVQVYQPTVAPASPVPPVTAQHQGPDSQDADMVRHEMAGQKAFKVIDNPIAYAAQLYKSGKDITFAEKSARVLVRKAVEGERIPVYSQGGILEANETGIAGKLVLTKAGPDGKPVIDEFGHENSWQADESVVRKKYEIPEGEIQDGICAKAAGGQQKFVQVDRDVCFMVPWGEGGSLIPQNIEAGGYMNITDPKDVYGISARDFNDTYQVLGFEPAPKRSTKDLDAAFDSIDGAGKSDKQDGLGG